MKTEPSTSDKIGRQPPVSQFTAFTILRDDRRRTTLRHCLHPLGHTTVAALIDTIAFHEGDDSPANRERIAIDLHHVHLPLLAEANLVRYDRTDGRIEARAGVSSLVTYLDAMSTSGIDDGAV